jgi:hypothetical protein
MLKVQSQTVHKDSTVKGKAPSNADLRPPGPFYRHGHYYQFLVHPSRGILCYYGVL